MAFRKNVVEIICFILMVQWCYEGVYKLAYFQQFEFYMRHAPLIKYGAGILKFVIPIGEILLALSFLVPAFRVNACYISIAALIIFILWIMSVFLFTHFLFWPYHALWKRPTWVQKMMISLALCWMALMAIVLSNPAFSLKKISIKSLRNTSAKSR